MNEKGNTIDTFKKFKISSSRRWMICWLISSVDGRREDLYAYGIGKGDGKDRKETVQCLIDAL